MFRKMTTLTEAKLKGLVEEKFVSQDTAITQIATSGQVIGFEASREQLLEKQSTKIDLKKRKAELLAQIKRQSEQNAKMDTNLTRADQDKPFDSEKEEKIK
jgi:hypothetical protein